MSGSVDYVDLHEFKSLFFHTLRFQHQGKLQSQRQEQPRPEQEEEITWPGMNLLLTLWGAPNGSHFVGSIKVIAPQSSVYSERNR